MGSEMCIRDRNLVSSFDNDSTVEAKVTQVVKGGLIATIDNVRAFIPGSQVTTHFVKDLSKYVGETLVCKVLNIDEKKRRLVLSHRAVVEAERKEIEDKAWENITVGEKITGKVQRLTDFGASVSYTHLTLPTTSRRCRSRWSPYH